MPMLILSYVIAGAGLAAVLCLIVIETAPNADVSLFLGRLFERPIRNLRDLNRCRVLHTSELAIIEKNIPRIQSVVIMSHRIDKPTRALHDAVLDNFQQGCRYTFFISEKGHERAELLRYLAWFKAIYDSAKGLAPEAGENSAIHGTEFPSLLSVKTLPRDWSYVPYVFYTFADEQGGLETVAFKGTTPGVGISEKYRRVPPTEAQVIMDLCSLASSDFDNAIGSTDVELAPALPATNVTTVDFSPQARAGGGQASVH